MRRLAARIAVAMAALALELVGSHLVRAQQRRSDPMLDPNLN
jgi:hypothetical protein